MYPFFCRFKKERCYTQRPLGLLLRCHCVVFNAVAVRVHSISSGHVIDQVVHHVVGILTDLL